MLKYVEILVYQLCKRMQEFLCQLFVDSNFVDYIGENAPSQSNAKGTGTEAAAIKEKDHAKSESSAAAHAV